jgi:hypothetical protein
MLQFTQMALIVKSHARCKAGESERHLVSAWQARLEHSRVKAFAINNTQLSKSSPSYTSFTPIS